MRLEHLRDMDFTHRRESPYDEIFTYVAACGTQEAGLYGERDALFRGERLGGTAGFVNHARRRGDGVSLADINGFIRPDDGAFAPFTIHGRTPPSHDGKRRLRGTVFLKENTTATPGSLRQFAPSRRFSPQAAPSILGIYICVHELA